MAVINNLGAPAFVSAATDDTGTTVIITFNMEMAENYSGQGLDFKYTVDGTERSFQGFMRRATNDSTKLELTYNDISDPQIP